MTSSPDVAESKLIAEKLREAYHNDLTDCPILLDGADAIDSLAVALDRMKAELDEAREWAKGWHRICQTICTMLGFGELDADEIAPAVQAALAASALREDALRKGLDLARGILSDMASSGIIVTDAHIEAYGSYFVEPGVFERLATLSDGETP